MRYSRKPTVEKRFFFYVIISVSRLQKSFPYTLCIYTSRNMCSLAGARKRRRTDGRPRAL